MTAIWHKTGNEWAILSPSGFPDEAALHSLVEEAPHVLPLSGAPRLVVLGREVRLGSGSADLVATEPEGRLCIVEVKLAKNAEARRAVVAQVLTYAAYLRGTPRQAFETTIIGSHIQGKGYDSLAAAVAANDVTGTFDPDAFLAGVDESLATGSFRLVMVLDAAPPELVKLVGYLELVAPQLVFDLVTVSPYDVAGTRILVPQRVDPEREADVSKPGQGAATKATYTMDGGVSFRERLAELPVERREAVRRLYDWAAGMQDDGLARLATYHGKAQFTLLPYLLDEDVGLATVWPDGNLAIWRSVFMRRAPNALPAVEQVLGKPLGQPTFAKPSSDAVLEAVRNGYREAKMSAGAGGTVTSDPQALPLDADGD